MVAVTPELKGVLSPGSPIEGDVVTLTLYENIPNPSMKLVYEVSDNQGNEWLQASQSTDGAVFTCVPKPGNGVITAKLTRTWDGAKASLALPLAVTPKATVRTTRFGVSMSDESHPDVDSGAIGGLAPGKVNWKSAHCYNQGDVDESAKYNVETIQLSDIALWNAGGKANLAGIKSSLEKMHAKRPDLFIEYSFGNEVNRHVTNYAMFEQNCHDIGVLVDPLDYAMFGISFTGECFRTPISQGSSTMKVEPFKNVIRKECTGPNRFAAANLYPPGRNATPATKSVFRDFVNPAMDTLKGLGVVNFACWEVATPMSSNYDRPSYMRDLRNYIMDYGKEIGLNVLTIDYWDQDIGVDLRLFHDWPKTAEAWTT